MVVQKVFEMGARDPALTADELRAVPHRTLVMVADDDIIIMEHTVEMYRVISNSQLAVMPGTSHFLVQEKPAACNAVILDFRTNDPVPTIAPVRRAGNQPGNQ